MEPNINMMTFDEKTKRITELKGSINDHLSTNKNLLERQTIKSRSFKSYIKETQKRMEDSLKLPEIEVPKRNIENVQTLKLDNTSNVKTNGTLRLNQIEISTPRKFDKNLMSHHKLVPSLKYSTEKEAQKEVREMGHEMNSEKYLKMAQNHKMTKEPEIRQKVNDMVLISALENVQPALHRKNLRIKANNNFFVESKKKVGDIIKSQTAAKKKLLGPVKKQVYAIKNATCTVTKQETLALARSNIYKKHQYINLQTTLNAVQKKDLSVKIYAKSQSNDLPTEEYEKSAEEKQTPLEIQKVATEKSEKVIQLYHYSRDIVLYKAQTSDLEKTVKDIEYNFPKEDYPRHSNSSKVTLKEIEKSSALKLEKALDKPQKMNQNNLQKVSSEVAQNDLQIKALEIEESSKFEISLYKSHELVLTNALNSVQESSEKEILKDDYLQHNNEVNLNDAVEPWIPKLENSVVKAPLPKKILEKTQNNVPNEAQIYTENRTQSIEYCKSAKVISKCETEMNQILETNMEEILEKNKKKILKPRKQKIQKEVKENKPKGAEQCLQNDDQFFYPHASHKVTQKVIQTDDKSKNRDEIMKMLEDLEKSYSSRKTKNYVKPKYPDSSKIIITEIIEPRSAVLKRNNDKPCKAPKEDNLIKTQKDPKSPKPKLASTNIAEQRLPIFEETKYKQCKDSNEKRLEKILKHEKSQLKVSKEKLSTADIEESRSPNIKKKEIKKPQLSSSSEALLNKIMDQADKKLMQAQYLNKKLCDIRIARKESFAKFTNDYWDRVRAFIDQQLQL